MKIVYLPNIKINITAIRGTEDESQQKEQVKKRRTDDELVNRKPKNYAQLQEVTEEHRLTRLRAQQEAQKSKQHSKEIKDHDLELGEDLQIKEEKYRISIAYPKLLSKRHSSLFIVHLYLPKMRQKDLQKLDWSLRQEPEEVIEESALEKGQGVKIKFFSPELMFSDSVVMKLDKDIKTTNLLAKPNDSCQPGTHKVILSISDAMTEVEYLNYPLEVKITDYAFDHISRPFLSKAASVVIGVGSLTMFILTLLGQIDTTLGLASGSVAGVLASGIYLQFYSMYQRPKIVNAP